MRAAIVESPGNLVVRDIPDPILEDAYQAKCEILFGATCTGTDLHIISNSLPWETPYPCVLGHESIGRVIEANTKARHYKTGDLVQIPAITHIPDIGSSWGGFAEFALITDFETMRSDGLDTAGANARVLPPGTDPAAATMLLTWCEGFAYIKSMGIERGTSCLLLGSGGNGLTFATAARARGAENIVMAGNPSRDAAARVAGVTTFVDYRSEELMELLKQACPDGYNFVVDVVGAGDLLNDSLDLIRDGATIGAYGLDDGFDSVLMPWNKPSFRWFSGDKDTAGAIDDVLGMMQDGSLDAGHWMDYRHPRPLEEIAQVYEELRERATPHPKAVIRVRG
jgi:threonine dehydrogenase-like Zn-dependent dehydrogenase